MSPKPYKLAGRMSLVSQGDIVKLCLSSGRGSTDSALPPSRGEILDCEDDCGALEHAETGESSVSTTTNCANFLVALRVSGRGCTHCERRAGLLQSQETCPEKYQCLMCKARWAFLSHEEFSAMLQSESERFVAGAESVHGKMCSGAGFVL